MEIIVTGVITHERSDETKVIITILFCSTCTSLQNTCVARTAIVPSHLLVQVLLSIYIYIYGTLEWEAGQRTLKIERDTNRITLPCIQLCN